jgi:DNA repair exonuclease SbcCD ATPase subunit
MVTLKKLRIKGFRAFMEEKEFSFDTPAILLFGENHNGKSSTLNAIEWCLFGNECIGTKSGIRERVDWEIPNRNLGSHPNVSIELELEDQDKKNYKIYRRYKSKTKDEFKVTPTDGQILEEEEAQKKIFNLMKASYRDFLTTVYQHQEAIRAVLTQEPRERNDAIDRLLGLSEYRNVLSAIDSAKLPAKQKEMGDDFDDFSDSIDTALHTREADLKDKKEKAIQKGIRADQFDEKAALSIAAGVKKQLEEFASGAGLNLFDLEIPQEWKELQQFQEMADDEIRRLRSELPDVKRQSELFSQRAEFTSLRTSYEKERQDYKKACEMLDKFINENGEKGSLNKVKSDIEKQIIEKEKEMSEADAKACTVNKAMEYLALEEVDKSICPVCGKETPDLFSHLKEEWEKKWEEKVGKIRVQIDGLRMKLKDTDSLLSQYRKLEEDIENVQGRVKEINDKIGKVLKREITDKDDSLVLLNNELGKIESELSKTKEAVEAKQETLNKISNSLDQMSLVTDILSLEEKKRVVEQITESEEYQQMEKLRDQMATLVNDLDKIKKTTSEASYERAQEKISTAERVIDKYFRQITNNSSVRSIRLSVTSDPKTSKNIYEFRDQDDKNVTPILSQGDLNGLALSIFLGMATLEDQQTGFIMLDDPSQSLGSSHKEKLVEVLDEVLNDRMVILSSMDKELQDLALSKIAKAKTKYIFTNWTPKLGPEIKRD